MHLALISDIHGNLVALDAVLADIAPRGIEHILCLGDVAASGPQPREVIARLREICCPIVMGNTDAWLLQPVVKEHTSPFAKRCQDIDLWCITQLSEGDKAFLSTFCPTIEWSLDDRKTLLGYHGSPRSFKEQLFPTTPDEQLAEALAGYQAAILAGGHTHIQMFRRYKTQLVLNPGSVGLPMDRSMPLDEVRNPPWAEYAIVKVEGRALNVELCRVPFDIDVFLEITLASGMPHADWSASEWLRA